jgi:hypothetical protein
MGPMYGLFLSLLSREEKMEGCVVVVWKESLWDGRIGGEVGCDHIGWGSKYVSLDSGLRKLRSFSTDVIL